MEFGFGRSNLIPVELSWRLSTAFSGSRNESINYLLALLKSGYCKKKITNEEQ